MYALSQADSSAVEAARAALPPCYSLRLDNCINYDNEDGLDEAQCATIQAGYAADDWQELDKSVMALRNCPPQSRASLAFVGLGGVVIGALLTKTLL